MINSIKKPPEISRKSDFVGKITNKIKHELLENIINDKKREIKMRMYTKNETNTKQNLCIFPFISFSD